MKRWLLNLILRKYFRVVTDDSFLKIGFHNNRKIILAGGTELPAEQVRLFEQEAELILSSTLYNKLRDHLTWVSYEHIFKTAKTADDLLFARGILYATELLHEKLKNIRK